MLHKEVIETGTYRILKSLMQDPMLDGFNLVGGTALSLYLGHRKSIDLDLFSKREFDVGGLRRHLAGEYGFKERSSESQTLKGEIDGVFIDCIRYDYPDISPVTIEDGIRVSGIPDILAMKLSAITDSGDREKDFVDVSFFSTKFSLNDMLADYARKYQGASTMAVMKALLYYDDVIQGEPVNLISGKYDWKLIQKRLNDMARHPDKIYKDFPILSNVRRRGLKI